MTVNDLGAVVLSGLRTGPWPVKCVTRRLTEGAGERSLYSSLPWDDTEDAISFHWHYEHLEVMADS